MTLPSKVIAFPGDADSALVVFSGGLDSQVALCIAAKALDERGYRDNLCALTVDYGQRNKRELGAARKICEVMCVKHKVIKMKGLSKMLPGNAITDINMRIPTGDYDKDHLTQILIPNRQMIILSIAAAVASANEIDLLVVGTLYGVDSAPGLGLPDTRPQFYDAFNKALSESLAGTFIPSIWTPLGKCNKAGVVTSGEAIGVDFSMSWSCFNDGVLPCGSCGACTARAAGFKDAGVVDTLWERTRPVT